MLKANIVKDMDVKPAAGAMLKKQEKSPKKRRAVYQTLHEEEQADLRAKTIGHGNMAKCEDATGLPRNTIMRAMGGDRILPVNAFKIRLYLAGKQVTEEAITNFLNIASHDKAGAGKEA